jgi:hypothetical protein
VYPDQRDSHPSVDELTILCGSNNFVFNTEQNAWQNTEWGYLVNGVEFRRGDQNINKANICRANVLYPLAGFNGRETFRGHIDPGTVASCPPNAMCDGFGFILFCDWMIESAREGATLTIAGMDKTVRELGGDGIEGRSIGLSPRHPSLDVYSTHTLKNVYMIANMKFGTTAPSQ